jgi:hypothetical protein
VKDQEMALMLAVRVTKPGKPLVAPLPVSTPNVAAAGDGLASGQRRGQTARVSPTWASTRNNERLSRRFC